MSHSEAVDHVREAVGQGIPVDIKAITAAARLAVQQATQQAAKETARQAQHYAREQGTQFASSGSMPMQACELCLTKHSVYTWVIIIAISSVILWYLLKMGVMWLKDLCTRPKYTQQYSEYEHRQRQDERQSSRSSGNNSRRRPTQHNDDYY